MVLEHLQARADVTCRRDRRKRLDVAAGNVCRLFRVATRTARRAAARAFERVLEKLLGGVRTAQSADRSPATASIRLLGSGSTFSTGCECRWPTEISGEGRSGKPV